MHPVNIVMLVILSLILYVVAFMALVKIFYALVDKYYASKGLGAFIWWILALIVWIPVVVLDLIHMIACAVFGFQAASALRDWWHRGVK